MLPSIRAPTLVVGFRHGRGVLDPAVSRVLADRDPQRQARADGEVDDPADAGWWHWYGRGDVILREIGVLLEDVRRQNVVFDRVLATVLFTDPNKDAQSVT